MPKVEIKQFEWEHEGSSVVVTSTSGTYDSDTKEVILKGIKIAKLASTASMKGFEGKITKCQLAWQKAVPSDARVPAAQKEIVAAPVGKKAKCTKHATGSTNAEFKVS